jgi:hypothetical protein
LCEESIGRHAVPSFEARIFLSSVRGHVVNLLRLSMLTLKERDLV